MVFNFWLDFRHIEVWSINYRRLAWSVVKGLHWTVIVVDPCLPISFVKCPDVVHRLAAIDNIVVVVDVVVVVVPILLPISICRSEDAGNHCGGHLWGSAIRGVLYGMFSGVGVVGGDAY